MNERSQHHQVGEIGPAVRVVMIPGTPWHQTTGSEETAEITPTANLKPWPRGCGEDADYGCVDQTVGEVCPNCGHHFSQVTTEIEHAYIDYSLVEEIFLARGEPVSAGEMCKCPCHGTR